MRECYIFYRKNGFESYIYIPWWHAAQLSIEYHFTEDILVDSDCHKIVKGFELKQIHDSHRPDQHCYDEIVKRVDELLRHVDLYDEIEIVLWLICVND